MLPRTQLCRLILLQRTSLTPLPGKGLPTVAGTLFICQQVGSIMAQGPSSSLVEHFSSHRTPTVLMRSGVQPDLNAEQTRLCEQQGWLRDHLDASTWEVKRRVGDGSKQVGTKALSQAKRTGRMLREVIYEGTVVDISRYPSFEPHTLLKISFRTITMLATAKKTAQYVLLLATGLSAVRAGWITPSPGWSVNTLCSQGFDKVARFCFMTKGDVTPQDGSDFYGYISNDKRRKYLYSTLELYAEC